MAWYIVTDSDWDWDSEAGDTVVEADSPMEAVQKVMVKWCRETAPQRPFDGATLKVGEIKLVDSLYDVEFENAEPKIKEI